jgi:AraC-like DNA-binding protein
MATIVTIKKKGGCMAVIKTPAAHDIKRHSGAAHSAKSDSAGSNNTEQFVVGEYRQALLAAFTLQGGSLKTLAGELGLTQTQLCASSGNISVDHYFELLRLSQVLTQDAFMGLKVGQQVQAATFSVLGEAMIKAPTLGAALQQVLVLEGLVHTLGHSQVTREPGAVRFVWHCHYQLHPQARPLVESVIAGIIQFANQLAGRPIPMMAASFMHLKPQGHAQAAYGLVCRSHCDFSQSQNSIVVADDVLAWPNKMARDLRIQANNTAQEAQPELRLSQKVVEYLQERLALGNPPLSEVAAQYHLSVRTFQRRLDREGTQYIVILNRVRKRLAKDYLLYSTMSTLHISQLLGFKEQSSFNHFFSENVNMTPTQFRRSGTQSNA